MSETRQDFVELFGEDQAAAIENAALEHTDRNPHSIHHGTRSKSSDPFLWACVFVIGFDCVKDPDFAKHHSITVSWEKFKAWLLKDNKWEKPLLNEYTGAVNYLAFMVGRYHEFVPEEWQPKS